LHERVDPLIDNAGVMAIPERRSVEMQFATNHLATYT